MSDSTHTLARSVILLVVADPHGFVQPLLPSLEQQGYDIHLLNDGSKALQWLQSRMPDLMIIDSALADMAGSALCKQLKAEERTAHLPVILLASSGDTTEKVQCFQNGADDIIVQPLVTEELLAKIKNQLALGTVRSTLAHTHRLLDDGINKLTVELTDAREKLQKEIEDRREAELEVRLSETKLLQALKQIDAHMDNSPMGMVEFDPQFRIIRWSGQAERIFGWSAQEIVGKTTFEVQWFHPEDERIVRQDAAALFSGIQQRSNHSTRNYRKDQSVIFCEWYNSAIYKPGGEMVSVMSLVLDITERKKAELALIESEERFRSTFEQAAVGIAHVDPTGKFLRVNDKLCHILGYPRTELVQYGWNDITYREDLGKSTLKVQQLLKGEVDLFSLEKRFIKKDNSMVWANVTVSLLRDRNNYAKYHIVVVEDISNRKQMEAQLIQAQKMEAVGILAGGIAHDFNNILSSILGFTELALDEVPPNSPMEEGLLEIFAAGRRGRDLVRQILTYARRSSHDVGPIRVAAVCEEVVNLLQPSIPNNIEIVTNLQCDPCVMADSSMIHQVILNLCTNGYQAMEKEGGRLQISLKELQVDQQFQAAPNEELAAGSYLELAVSDSGSGIDPEILGSIFLPYFTTKETGKGTGMGLAVVHGIVQGCGGAIRVESNIDKGTTFRVFLPVCAKTKQHNAYPDESMNGNGELILLVDDEHTIIRMLTKILTQLGYQVESCDHPLKALQTFTREPDKYDLIIAEMNIPQMGGEQLAVEFLRVRPGVPILLSSGYSTRLSNQQAIQIGVRGLISKPFIINDLARVIRDTLDVRQQGGK